MVYADPATVQATDPGDPLTAAWCDVVRDDLEFLIDPPTASYTDSTGTSVPSGAGTVTALGGTGAENFDNDSLHSDSTNRGRMTFQTAGRYLVLSTVLYPSHTGAANSFIRTSLRVNGTTSYGGMQLKNNAGATQPVRLQATRALVFAAGDYVEPTATQDLGGTVNPVTVDEFFVQFLTRA